MDQPRTLGEHMATEIEIVAMHEAGHALAILLMPIRPHIHRAWAYQNSGRWYGKTEMEPNVWHPLDPYGVYNFTKALGGPLAQLISYPDSAGPLVENLLSATGTLIEVARKNLHNCLGIETNWWDD